MHYQNSVLKTSQDSRFLRSPNQPEAEHHLAPDCCCWPPRTAKRGRFCSPKPGLRTEGGGTTGPGTPLHPRKHSLQPVTCSFPSPVSSRSRPPSPVSLPPLIMSTQDFDGCFGSCPTACALVPVVETPLPPFPTTLNTHTQTQYLYEIFLIGLYCRQIVTKSPLPCLPPSCLFFPK